MKRKIWLLCALSLFFYAAVHLSVHVPGFLHGKFTYVDERPWNKQLLSLIAELILSFLFCASTYLSFYRYYPVKRYTRILVWLLSISAVIFLLGYVWNQMVDEHPADISRFFRNNVLFDAMYMILGMVFFFVRYSRYRELREKELQLQVYSAELSFLRSQVSPHFLFNNLNNIYSLVYRGSPDALHAIAVLSELLRYMLYNQSDTISLSRETGYIEKFIALQQLRYERPTRIKIDYPAEHPSVHIPPLLLIPFVENAFKHGAPDMEEEWLWVDMAFDGNSVTFKCLNKIGSGLKEQTGGIGIDNVRKRLGLLYPGRHRLDILVENDLFTVNLKLDVS